LSQDLAKWLDEPADRSRIGSPTQRDGTLGDRPAATHPVLSGTQPCDGTGETTMSLGGGYMLASRDGRQIPAIGLGITMKTDGKSTHDAYSLFEYAIPARTDGPPPHLHTREDESFLCLAGRLDVTLGSKEFVLEHGDYLFLPRDVVHTFRNTTEQEARVASVVSPAGLEAYYQALADLPPGPKDVSVLKTIMAEFGIELQLPPQVD
jgi:mannose-6-phosphate isomerase-like protein (cupin superfamily)